MGNFMDTVFNSIDDFCELTIAMFRQSPNGDDYYYLSEQSCLQVLRELPIQTPIRITDVFSERHRIFKEIGSMKGAKNVGEALKIILPLVEDGNFPCKNITIIIDDKIKLESYNDYEVHLVSSSKVELQKLIRRIVGRQYFNPDIVNDITDRPNLYLRLERPKSIVATYSSLDEVIEAD
jgi:hypothetical protein